MSWLGGWWCNSAQSVLYFINPRDLKSNKSLSLFGFLDSWVVRKVICFFIREVLLWKSFVTLIMRWLYFTKLSLWFTSNSWLLWTRLSTMPILIAEISIPSIVFWKHSILVGIFVFRIKQGALSGWGVGDRFLFCFEGKNNKNGKVCFPERAVCTLSHRIGRCGTSKENGFISVHHTYSMNPSK